MNKVNDCFSSARKDEEKNKKHKGLLIIEKDNKKAEEYIKKAKKNLELCEIYKKERFDYMIPEAWFYTQYYCALAILAKFGVESRSQRCTALFLKFVKDKGIIDYDNLFIQRITVYSEKETISDVDDREKSRYGSATKSEEIIHRYSYMINTCKKAIDQCEEIIFSKKDFEVPKEFLDNT